MQEIIHAFGIDWRLIVIQIFNFSVLAGILWYFLYTPVLNLLAERELKIKKGIGAALRQADSEKHTILTEAHSEASAIVARASVHAEEKGSEIVIDAQHKAERVAQDAAQKALEIKAQAYKESEAEIAQVAILAAEKILNQKLG